MKQSNCDENYHENPKILWFASLISLIGGIIEFFAGHYTGSYALIADSFHMFFDTSALWLAGIISLLSRHIPKQKIRVKTAGAFINASALIILALFMILPEILERLFHPREIISFGMFVIACAGLVLNIWQLKLLGPQSRNDINTRGAYIHVFGDYASSLGVVAAAIVIFFSGWNQFDAYASFLALGVMLMTAGRVIFSSISEIFRNKI